uniref:PH domain-containing protein n=1 Tax=Amblyomma maculatum TaxID=34609 RepID=G3MQ76_AMBMU
MEGVLWKWTNYWNGWQPRWFILDKGILTYYKSQDEVNQGCKGSVKVSACEIVVHPTDNRRLDLVIPSEQHFYLRAPTPSERQQWLVALGSSKAATAAVTGGHTTQPTHRLGGHDPEGSLSVCSL